MSEKIHECMLCGSTENVSMIFSMPSTSVGTTKKPLKPGELVKEFIQNSKDDIREQKSDLARGYEDEY